MTPRDEQILRHVARHRLSIRPVLHRLFFKSSDAAGNVIARLLKAELIEASKFPDGFSYYQLTDEGARAIGLAKAPRLRDAQALRVKLEVLLSSSTKEGN